MSIPPDEEGDDLLTRRETRLDDLRQERRDAGVVAFFGLAMLAMGTGLLWMVAVSLRTGFIDLDDGPELLYAADNPVAFYSNNAFSTAMGLFCAVLGVQMLLHARREVRRTARGVERLSRVGTRRG